MKMLTMCSVMIGFVTQALLLSPANFQISRPYAIILLFSSTYRLTYYFLPSCHKPSLCKNPGYLHATKGTVLIIKYTNIYYLPGSPVPVARAPAKAFCINVSDVMKRILYLLFLITNFMPGTQNKSSN